MKKRILSLMLMTAMLFGLFTAIIPMSASAAYDNTFTFTINGTNTTPPSGTHSKVYLYTNTGSSTKTINCNDSSNGYNFRDSKVMIFNSSGRIIECGGNLTSATSPITGAPQLYLYIPAGGFMIAFGSNNTNLMKMYNVVMEGAMLYNSTMSVIYEAYASYSGSTLTVKYNNPKPASSKAIKFLFVGNSTTYFNGTPIKFKAMAQAAGVEVDVTYCTRGSAYLSYFVDPARDGLNGHEDHNKALKEALAAKKYDYVVLQDAAKADYYVTKPSVEKLLPLIEANGAKAVLYMRYSAAYTFTAIRDNAIKHHNNYATIASEFNLVCSPVADAFVHCAEKYPSIGLYASDGGHHSKEGSYLIAATWLQSYLGINPVGNTYTADMSATTVARLQECAKLACDIGYPYPGMENDYVENGVSYKNIAKGKSYTSSGEVYTGDQTDLGTDGKIIGKLTDGTVATSGDQGAVGCWKGKSVDITIDLQGVYNIKNLKTDLSGNTWGIPHPEKITVTASASMDNVNFKSVGKFTITSQKTQDDWAIAELQLKPTEELNARYVRFTFTNTEDKSTFIWASELRVYGNETNVTTSDSNVALNKPYTAGGIHYADGVAPYPDENGKTLTDGKVAYSATNYSDTAFVGFNRQADEYKANGYAYIIVELGDTYDMTRFVGYVSSTANGNKAAGILPPESMTVCGSNDGRLWTDIGTVKITDDSTKNCISATLTVNTPATYKYVQFRFKAPEGYNWLMIAEVEAHGTKATSVQPDPTPTPDPEPTPDPDPTPDPEPTPDPDPTPDPEPKPDPTPDFDIETEVMLGDVNGSTDIDSMDYVLVKRAYFGTFELTDDQLKAADVNDSGEIDSMDYVLIKRAYFGTFSFN